MQNVESPTLSQLRGSKLQGKPIERRVQDEGASERSSVMEEIRVERSPDVKAG